MDIKHFPIPGIAFYTFRQKTKKGMITVVKSCGDKLGICKKGNKRVGGYEFQAILHTGMNDRWAPTLKALLAKVEHDGARRYHLITKFSRAETRLDLIDSIAGRYYIEQTSSATRTSPGFTQNMAHLFAGIARPIVCQPAFAANRGSEFIRDLEYMYSPSNPIWLFIKLV